MFSQHQHIFVCMMIAALNIDSFEKAKLAENDLVL